MFIQDLPVELLVSIFYFYVHDQDVSPFPLYDYQRPLLSAKEYNVVNPFILSHVDQLWRSITQNTPSLWSTLYVMCPSAGSPHLLKAWLKFAEGVPLFLHLRTSGHHRPRKQDDDVVTAEVLDLLFLKHESWGGIKMSLDHTYEYQPILKSLENFQDTHLPKLQEAFVTFFFRDLDYVAQGERIINIIHAAPNLQHLVVSYDQVDSTIEGNIEKRVTSFPNWENLTSYFQASLDFWPISAVFALLGACTSLKYLHSQIGNTHSAEEPKAPLEHDLEELSLNVVGDCSVFFRYLILPSLVAVTLEEAIPNGGDSISFLVPPFLELLEKSPATLTELTIFGLVDDSILPLLASSQLHRLAELRINGYRDAKRLFTFLTRRKGDRRTLAILPSMEIFSFAFLEYAEAENDKRSEWSAAKNMLESRVVALEEPTEMSLSLLKYSYPSLQDIDNYSWSEPPLFSHLLMLG